MAKLPHGQWLGAVALAASLAALPAAAQDDRQAQGELDDAGKLALQAANKMVRALELFLDDLPKYEPPEVLDNGDIILRRVNPPDGSAVEEPAIEQDRVERKPSDEDGTAPDLPRSNRSPDGEGGGDGQAAGGERRI